MEKATTLLNNCICCQIGAREHYAVPNCLNKNGKLDTLYTDLWIKPGAFYHFLPARLNKRLVGRYHSGLNGIVTSFNKHFLLYEAIWKMTNKNDWSKIIARNEAFQRLVIKSLSKKKFPPETIFYSYSYASSQIFRYAKEKGYRVILNQIDPGPEWEARLLMEHQQRKDYKVDWTPAPDQYWASWQDECEMADKIVVNSEWSKRSLIDYGIKKEKIKIIPLSYEHSQQSIDYKKTYPNEFTRERPLRILFLGQVVLGKGIAALIDALNLLVSWPIELWLVGPVKVKIPYTSGNVKIYGVVPRSEVQNFYKQADVFIFPTLSDGFGLTQLEAQSWKLPGIVSPFCADVYTHDKDGVVLKEITRDSIATAIESLFDTKKLQDFSNNIFLDSKYSETNLIRSLNGIFD